MSADPSAPGADADPSRPAADRALVTSPEERAEQLAGFRVGVTADRRSADLNGALARRGATVVHAPTLRIEPVATDAALVADTRAVLAAAPAMVLVTTSFGLTGWLEAADAAGLGEDLLGVLGGAEVCVRGPKARGAVRGAGLGDAGAGVEETTASLVDLAVERLRSLGAGHGGPRPTVVVQLHGWVDTAQLARLSDAGARVLTVAPYRWTPPPDPAAVGRLVEATVARTVDALVFTSAPAAAALLRAADDLGRGEALRAAMRSDDVLVAAVGSVTAEPLRHAGVPSVSPERHRLGALIRCVTENLVASVRRVPTAVGLLELRGALAVLDGAPHPLTPSAVALLRLLAASPGAVVPRERLRAALPDAGDHAVEVAVARLRAAVGAPGLVTTVVKRGYRLGT